MEDRALAFVSWIAEIAAKVQNLTYVLPSLAGHLSTYTNRDADGHEFGDPRKRRTTGGKRSNKGNSLVDTRFSKTSGETTGDSTVEDAVMVNGYAASLGEYAGE